MNVTRFNAAPEYFPANHDDLSASPVEKHYVVLEGTLTILTDTEEVTLERHDSVRIAPGEKRKLENRSDRPAAVLLAMPYPPAS